MTYQKTIDWLFEQFPAYQHVGVSAYKPDLDNVLQLCKLWKIDYKHLKFIHVAGTNGKGSTSNFLASIFQEANYKTGLFTSPHISDFRERIRVNGKKITQDKVIRFCSGVQKSKFNIQPSFFEITWVLALKHFIDEKCEICIIETGLGGRLDATNIISPILSIITSIGLDHTTILGDSLEKIAFEKAGIIKNCTPVILGKMDNLANDVMLNKAEKENATIFNFEDFKNLPTFHQKNTYLANNELLVRKAISVLQDKFSEVSNLHIDKGIQNVAKNTGFQGRFQIISKKPLFIIDAAHNEDGINELLKAIKNFTYNNLIVIYGASNDKDVLSILNLFPKNCQFIFSPFSNQRSLKTEELSKLKSKIQQKSIIVENCSEAVGYAKTIQNEGDILILTGSFFLLSDFFSFFSKKDLLK